MSVCTLTFANATAMIVAKDEVELEEALLAIRENDAVRVEQLDNATMVERVRTIATTRLPQPAR